MVKLKKNQASNYEDKYLYIYKRCQNYSDFKKNIYKKSNFFILFSFIFLAIGFSNIFYVRFYSILFSYASLCLVLWYTYQTFVYFTWKKTGRYTNLPVYIKGIRLIVYIVMILPMKCAAYVVHLFVERTRTYNMSDFAMESFISVICSLWYSSSITFLIVKLLLYKTPFISWLLYLMPSIEESADFADSITSTIICYSFLFAWFFYKLIRNAFLLCMIKSNPSSVELGDERCKVVQKKIIYDLDTIGLLLILVCTIILTPLKTDNDIFEYASKAFQYICITNSAYVTLKGHIK